jgi:hypothetical protein
MERNSGRTNVEGRHHLEKRDVGWRIMLSLNFNPTSQDSAVHPIPPGNNDSTHADFGAHSKLRWAKLILVRTSPMQSILGTNSEQMLLKLFSIPHIIKAIGENKFPLLAVGQTL